MVFSNIDGDIQVSCKFLPLKENKVEKSLAALENRKCEKTWNLSSTIK